MDQPIETTQPISPHISLEAKLEAILFWKAEPLTYKKLAELLKISEEDIKTALQKLQQSFVGQGRGLSLVLNDTEVMLGTEKQASALIEEFTKEELTKDLGKAGLETLSIILYQGPITRAEIDYIRGVSSQFVVRNLLIRGLIEKVENSKDQRSFLYKPTLLLLSYLGVSQVADLPEYTNVRTTIETFKTSHEVSAH